MSKLFPVFLKWTIWGFSLETYNHQDICIHRCLTCWFSPLHVPGCERTWVLWFFWFIWVFKYFLGNVRTSKFYNLCFYLKKKKRLYWQRKKISFFLFCYPGANYFILFQSCWHFWSVCRAWMDHRPVLYQLIPKMHLSLEITFVMAYIWPLWCHNLRSMNKI